MENLETATGSATHWLSSLWTTDIYGGKSVADLVTLDTLVGIAANIAGAIAIILLGIVISGMLGRRIKRLGEKHARLDDTLFNFLSNIVRYAVLGFTALFVLNTFGVQTTSIVAVIGAAGLAIGLALQGTLSNVAAGVMIILFRPLKIGDFVAVDDVMGTVKDITLNFTEIADMSNVKVVVPNSEVWGNKIRNYSVYPTRRAEWSFGVGYGVNLARAEEVIRQTITADERTHTDPAPFVQVNNLGSSSVDFLVRAWCDSAVFFQYQADMKRRVKEALDEAEINIPFPTRTLIHDTPAVRLVQDDDKSDPVAAE